MRRWLAVALVAVALVACGHQDHRARLMQRCSFDTDHVADCGAIVNYAMSAANAKGCHDLQDLEAVDRLAQPFVYGRQSEAEFETTFATCDHPNAPLPAGWSFEPAPPSTAVYVPPAPLPHVPPSTPDTLTPSTPDTPDTLTPSTPDS